ncbi:hypothetical protein [Epilithonimonas hungarica]|uniref:Uncharacterized protein n=1 Tax=Epilithonimonas hungarica TaxID=454006 RepID=A0A1G7RT25_9FLAO|nr:hypothetical protein [Epilithonimonas hungarica]SDG13875.1 hypothetical protein SAMN05421825_2770 [Epilithonimonas hungarica]
MDHNKEILKKSKKRLQKLKLLSKFFDNVEIINIIIRTELIQSYFDVDSLNGLDINKLELFHLQYTDTLIVLLEKIKKQKEANILAIYKEMDTNEEYIDRYVSQKNSGKNFDIDRKYQNALMSGFLRALYDNLTGTRKEMDFTQIRSLSNNYSIDYYRKTAKLEYLMSFSDTRYYEYDNIKVERKLLGKLNVGNFKVRFVCGYNIEDQVFELYKISDNEEDFIWNLQTNEFYFLADDIALLLDRSANTCSKKSIINELKNRNTELKTKSETIKTDLPEDILLLLRRYKETLDNQKVIDQVINVDEEMNVLNSMLNLDLNNKLQ